MIFPFFPVAHLVSVRSRPLEGEELWLMQKREEVWRMNPQARREWIKAGAVPAPRYGV